MNPLASVGAAVVAAALAPAALGEPERIAVRRAGVDDLKAAYLSCNAQMAAGRLPTSAVMACSMVYEELKSRAFGGDFEKLLAWSQAQARNSQALRTSP